MSTFACRYLASQQDPGGSTSSRKMLQTGNDNSTFLRGTVLTDSNGVASFTSIFPGWYAGGSVCTVKRGKILEQIPRVSHRTHPNCLSIMKGIADGSMLALWRVAFLSGWEGQLMLTHPSLSWQACNGAPEDCLLPHLTHITHLCMCIQNYHVGLRMRMG